MVLEVTIMSEPLGRLSSILGAILGAKAAVCGTRAGVVGQNPHCSRCRGALAGTLSIVRAVVIRMFPDRDISMLFPRHKVMCFRAGWTWHAVKDRVSPKMEVVARHGKGNVTQHSFPFQPKRKWVFDQPNTWLCVTPHQNNAKRTNPLHGSE